jgi:succinate-acetate transporter protein
MSSAAEPQHAQGLPIADPTPIGLICLAIGCAALVPIAFGAGLTPSGFRTAAMFCLLFGAGGQLVAGLGSLLNRNVYGGTLFTSFAFNWVMNWWALDSLSRGQAPDATIVFAVDVCFLIVFLVFTYGFGFFSSLLMAFLVDIDLLYVARIARHLGGGDWLGLVVGICTVALGALSLWIAFALLVNPVARRAVFAFPGPVFRSRASSRPS